MKRYWHALRYHGGILLTVAAFARNLYAQQERESSPGASSRSETSFVDAEDELAFAALSLQELFALKVTLASKEEDSIGDAPSSVSVYTEREIRALGVRTLSDLLAMMPGFDVRPSNQIDVRGIGSSFNGRILVLLDGIPMDDAYYGATGKVPDSIYLDYVERVEVIRGTGSALYGTNAFAAVVSVTTKAVPSMASEPALELGLGTGSNREGRGSAVFAERFNDWRASAYGDLRRADGPVYALLPRDLGRSGDVTQRVRDLSAGFKVGYRERMTLSLDYLRRDRAGLVVTDNTLRPDSGYVSNWLGSSLAWNGRFNSLELHSRLFGAWDCMSDADLLVVVPHVSPRFDNGLYEHPELESYRGGWESFAHYSYGKQSFLLGALFEVMESPDLYGGAPTNGREGPARGPNERLLLAKMRRIGGVYAQYRWDIFSSLRLTAGGRLDSYSDFGTTFNPRVALVSTPNRYLYSKAILGSAFRAPAFSECCANSNQYMLGNLNLKPERIVSTEVALGVLPVSELDLSVTAFRNHISEIITQAPLTSGSRLLFANAPGFDTLGLETELKVSFGRSLSGRGNYTYVYGWRNDPGLDATVPYIASHLANFAVTGDFFEHLRVTPTLQLRGPRARDSSSGDPRSEVRGAIIVNLNLTVYDALVKHLEFSLYGKNLLDQEILGPSAYPGRNSTVVPGDIPSPGREVFATVRYGMF